MDKRQIGLALVLREVDQSASISDFDSRLILQKSVYLLEEAGIRFGYSFNWYLRGPYSPGLTRDLYSLDSGGNDIEDWVLDPGSRQIAERMRTLLQPQDCPDVSSRARRLELLASLLYLQRRQQLDVTDCEKATSELAKNGKLFGSNEVESAIGHLQEYGLL